MNQITIVFTPCSPEPENGYLVFYREVGEVDFIQYPDSFTSSPIIFQVDGPVEQPYEGYIISDCGEGVFGPEVSWETVLCPPPDGCCDPEVIDAEAETTIPDGSGSESGSEPGGEFLRLVFNVDMSGESLSDWNVFFGFTFDNVIYSGAGTIVDLYLSNEFTIPFEIFKDSTTLVRVIDFSNLVVGVADAAFNQSTSLVEIDLPACLTIGGIVCFLCTALTDVNLPLLTDLPDQCFAGCNALVNFNAPLVETIGIAALDFTGMATVNFPNVLTIASSGMRSMVNLTTLSLPNCVSIGDEGLRTLQVCTTVDLPACLTIGDRCFRAVAGIQVLNLPVCTNIGLTTGNDSVFSLITGETIVFTLKSGTETDTDVTILQANNSVTLILV